jgi:hypothetical protein
MHMIKKGQVEKIQSVPSEVEFINKIIPFFKDWRSSHFTSCQRIEKCGVISKDKKVNFLV